jgi:hypothetical protein
MEIDVTDIDSRSDRYTKGLNSAVQVHVKKSKLIMPDAGRRMGHLVTHVPDTIVAGIRLLPGY